MTITSFWFFLFVLLSALVYYLVPKKLQWTVLLAASLIFYFLAATPYTLLYLLISTMSAYGASMAVDSLRRKASKKLKYAGVITAAAIVLNVAVWFVFKGTDLWQPVGRRLCAVLGLSSLNDFFDVRLLAALGMGYYTLQVIGYILDCYWESAEPQRNPLKLLLFVAYFPQLTTGPISRYHQLKSLYEPHGFRYKNLCWGAQRILWGLLKKVVLAERIGLILSGLSGTWVFQGFYAWAILLLYPIQMYADFSGCMDIVLGTSEIFGIGLPENFRNPFFSRSSQEFWQRWHITLGSWAKDYVLYPLLKSKFMLKLGKASRKRFGKKAGKFIATSVGMFALWMVMGLWHGGFRYIIGVSLWYWLVLMAAELFAPFFARVNTRLGIKTESFSWHLFQSARVYITYAIGATFFANGVFFGLMILKEAFLLPFGVHFNPWVLFDGSITVNLGSVADINVIIVAIALMFAVAVLRERHHYAREWMASQCLVFRWSVWLLMFLFVLVFGLYGPYFNASQFIYQGF